MRSILEMKMSSVVSFLFLLSFSINVYLLVTRMTMDGGGLCELQRKYGEAEKESSSETRKDKDENASAADLLKQLFDKFGSDKGYQHGYHRYYGPLLYPLKEAGLRLVEVGVEEGRSVMAWLHYFDRPNHIYGIGYGQSNGWQDGGESECFKDQNLPCTLFKGDQSDLDFLEHFKKKTGGQYDIVIDDGSHVPNHQKITFEALWSSVVPGGYYVIEDVETSYWKEEASIYGYAFTNQKSFIEHMKLLADVVNKKYSNYNSPLSTLYDDISSVKFGANIVIVQKQTEEERQYFEGTYKHESDSAGKPLPYP